MLCVKTESARAARASGGQAGRASVLYPSEGAGWEVVVNSNVNSNVSDVQVGKVCGEWRIILFSIPYRGRLS